MLTNHAIFVRSTCSCGVLAPIGEIFCTGCLRAARLHAADNRIRDKIAQAIEKLQVGPGGQRAGQLVELLQKALETQDAADAAWAAHAREIQTLAGNGG